MPVELQFNNYFARVHYDFVAKNAVKNSNGESELKESRSMSVVEISRQAWARSKDPLVEFVNR